MTNRINDHIDINNASVEELCAIKGVGSSLADRIVAARPYETLEDLKNVKGIGDKLFEQMFPFLFLSTPTSEKETASTPAAQSLPPAERSAQPEVAAQTIQLQAEPAEPVLLDIPIEPASTVLPPSAETPVEHIEQAEIKPTEEAVSAKEKEPFVAVGETVQSVFYPVEEEPAVASRAPHQEQKPSRAIQIIEHPRERQESSAQTEKATYIRRNEMFAWLGGASMLSILLGVLLTLAILAIVNGSLRFLSVKQAQLDFAALQSQLDDAGQQITVVREGITSLRTRMDALETLSGRISTLETDTADIRSELTEASGLIEEIASGLEEASDMIDLLSAEVIEIKETSGVFKNFLQQLQVLLNDLIPSELEGGLQ